ncbi:exosortase A [soil metagenome]
MALPPLVLLIAAILFLYRDTATAMVLIWARSETFAHAFLVPPIALWLAWRKREVLAGQSPKPAPGLLIPMALIAAVWLLGDVAASNAMTQLAFTALLVLSVPAVLGLGVARTLMFPLGFLFFAVPVGEFLLPLLMSWTADFTVFALRLSGIPVYREGQQLVIPSGNWSVVEACSGVRYLIASLMVGVLFAYLNYRSSTRRWIFVGVSVLVPIVANWVRAYLIVLLGHLSNNTIAVGADHLIYGWVFFGFVITLMFLIGVRWSEPPPIHHASRSSAPLAGATTSRGATWAVAASAGLLALLPHLALRAIEVPDGERSATLTTPATLADGWRANDGPMAQVKPVYHQPSAEILGSYSRHGNDVRLYVAYYRHQDFDHKLIDSDNVLVHSENHEWSALATGSRVVQIDGEPIAVRTTELRGAANRGLDSQVRLVAWQLYWVNGRLTNSDLWAKAYGAYHRLMGRGDDGAVIVIYTREQTSGSADAVLESFLRANLPLLRAEIAKAGGVR